MRKLLRFLVATRWRRAGLVLLLVAGTLALFGKALILRMDARWFNKRILISAVVWHAKYQAWRKAERARAWSPGSSVPAASPKNAAELYRTTNIWLAHLAFTRANWDALEPRQFKPGLGFSPDGMILLRNPNAPRNGLAGVFGYAFDWTRADFEIGGLRFAEAGVRAKGNFAALLGGKLPFKVDLNKHRKAQKLEGMNQFVLNNLAFDPSNVAESLAFEVFRDAGLPAPRTAYAWLTVSVQDKFDRQPFGLYTLIEPINEEFALDRFGSKTVPLFKPVTYEFLDYLGDDWAAYAGIYDLKTKASPAQRKRLMDLARLVSNADDAEFRSRIGEFVDLDEFGGFLACEVLISNYDSLLSTGQNFFMYLDPRSNKFGFIPWDMDAAWGRFWVGSREELANASIWHPWVGRNRFLERVLKTPEFRGRYRSRLEELLPVLLNPDRLQKRVDAIAAILRAPIAAESQYRLEKFEQEIGAKPSLSSRTGKENGLDSIPYPIKNFAEARSRSIREQLAGKSEGVVIKAPRQR